AASTTRASMGTGHSPRPPAHTMRSPRTSVTACGTGARPDPSHSMALVMAMVGSRGTVEAGLGAVPAHAPSRSVAEIAETTEVRPIAFTRASIAGTDRFGR